ncbi:hypothetical protein [Paenibacillus foliorum]|uniref:hypothetical protein n=1 Tax=Paenibacillus foliorum TaxID=2654974 RepID=UPI001C0F930A|nr:hypothetical protein [Paenibacillus foliorum]
MSSLIAELHPRRWRKIAEALVPLSPEKHNKKRDNGTATSFISLFVMHYAPIRPYNGSPTSAIAFNWRRQIE